MRAPAAAHRTPAGVESVWQLLQQRARTQPQQEAYRFLDAQGGSLTWHELLVRAEALGARLIAAGVHQQPVLIALPCGLPFIVALFACWQANAIAVPLNMPRHRRLRDRLEHIIADAGAHLIIGDRASRECLAAAGERPTLNLEWLAESVWPATSPRAPLVSTDSGSRQLALLQYTSGSTGAPRGVMVTHGNLIHNGTQTAELCGHRPGETICSWLPLFHDMGLIGHVVQAVVAGMRCVFMAPERFLMRPWLWLQMISEYRACSSAAPNFAYDLCVERIAEEHKVGLDLSCWRNAINGSEVVRPSTLERFAAAFASCGFARSAFMPCYGLAEATLLATGRHELRTARSAARTYVSCGPPAPGTHLVIVDPQTRSEQSAGEIGEVWLRGPSVALGYWRDRVATLDTFGAGPLAWLRTGDLGCVLDGELFITGRLRELIILSGRNHFPVDLEHTVEAADERLNPHGSVAFAIEARDREALVVVAELRRERAAELHTDPDPAATLEALRRRLGRALAEHHDIAPHEIVLVKAGVVPRTSSGKLMRLEARRAYLSGELPPLIETAHVLAAI